MGTFFLKGNKQMVQGFQPNRTTQAAPSSGSVTVETPPEPLENGQITFTATGTPKWVVADGIVYFEGAGYTYSAPTITMVDIIPSQYVRIIL